MRRELKKIQAENSALAQKVQGGRESISQTEHRISAAVDEWKVRERERERVDNCQNRYDLSLIRSMKKPYSACMEV